MLGLKLNSGGEGERGFGRNLSLTTCFRFLCAGLQKLGNQILRNTDLADKGTPLLILTTFLNWISSMLMVCLSGQVGLKIMISWMRHQDRGDNCVARTMWFCETRVQPLNPLLFAFSPPIWSIRTWNGSIRGRCRHFKETPHFPLWQLLSNWVKHVFVYFANWDRMMIMIKIPSEMEVAPRYNCWNC